MTEALMDSSNSINASVDPQRGIRSFSALFLPFAVSSLPQIDWSESNILRFIPTLSPSLGICQLPYFRHSIGISPSMSRGRPWCWSIYTFHVGLAKEMVTIFSNLLSKLVILVLSFMMLIKWFELLFSHLEFWYLSFIYKIKSKKVSFFLKIDDQESLESCFAIYKFLELGLASRKCSMSHSPCLKCEVWLAFRATFLCMKHIRGIHPRWPRWRAHYSHIPYHGGYAALTHLLLRKKGSSM